MAFNVLVRRGVEVPDGTVITPALLRALGKPVVLVEGTVASEGLADDSVQARHIAGGQVTTVKIAVGAVTTEKLANSAVENDNLAPGAVTADKSTPGAYWYGPGLYATTDAPSKTGTYAITLSPAVPIVATTTYAPGLQLTFTPDIDNPGPVDLNINARGVKSLWKAAGQELLPGDLRAGKPVAVIYDGVAFLLVGEPANAHPLPFVVTVGSGTAYTISQAATLFPRPSALYSGLHLCVKFHAASGAAPTLAVDGLAAKHVLTHIGSPLIGGDIAEGDIHQIVYSATADGGLGGWLLIDRVMRSSGPLPMPAGGIAGGPVLIPHGMGFPPREVSCVIVRIAEGFDPGFPDGVLFPIPQGTEIPLEQLNQFDNSKPFQVLVDATNIRILRLGDIYGGSTPPARTPNGVFGQYEYLGNASTFSVDDAAFREQYALKAYWR